MWQTHGMEMQPDKRYLLCRPEGGLNDIFSEIGKCIRYGKIHNRFVVVQTNSQDHFTFKDDFSRYFEPFVPNLKLSAEAVLREFDTMSVYPPFLVGRINSYKKTDFTNEGLSKAVTFDFSKDYAEQVLVHHSFGQQKGRNALIALSRLHLNDRISKKLAQRLQVLGPHYDAFHIRHTDYKTDFKHHVLALAPHIHGRVFLATDNKDVVEFFESVFGKDRLFAFSTLPDVAGQPLHYSGKQQDNSSKNDDAILDLLTLCLATDYHFFPREIKGRSLFAAYSGFSSLGARLRFSPSILRNLLPQHLHERIWLPSVFDRAKNLRWVYF